MNSVEREHMDTWKQTDSHQQVAIEEMSNEQSEDHKNIFSSPRKHNESYDEDIAKDLE